MTFPLPRDRASLDRLTSLRFFAALLVVVHHGTLELVRLPVLAPLSVLGYVGVTFFFLLSGFVLTWSGSPDLARRHFYGRRFARIYPTHVATLLIAVVLSLLIGLEIGAGPLGTNLTLTQSWVPLPAFTGRLNNVSWSLADEAFFYALFPFLFVRWQRLATRQVWRRVGVVVLLTLICVAVIHESLPAELAGEVVYKAPVMRAAEFLIGMGLALAMRRGLRSPVSVGAAVAIAGASYVGMSTGLAMLGWSGLFRVIPDYAMIVPFALLVLAAATADLQPTGAGRGLARGRLVFAGRASYQLYMTHFLLVMALRPGFGHLPGRWQPLVFCAFVLGSIAVSLIAYRCFEVPTERWLRNRLGGAGVQRRPPCARESAGQGATGISRQVVRS